MPPVYVMVLFTFNSTVILLVFYTHWLGHGNFASSSIWIYIVIHVWLLPVDVNCVELTAHKFAPFFAESFQYSLASAVWHLYSFYKSHLGHFLVWMCKMHVHTLPPPLWLLFTYLYMGLLLPVCSCVLSLAIIIQGQIIILILEALI